MTNASAGPGASLSAKQKRFVEEYLVDLNATQAAIRAGYSEKSARSQGHRLLTNADIEAAIQAARSERSDRTEITQDRILMELAKIGFSDMRKLLTQGGALLDPQEWDDETAGAVQSIEVVTSPGSETDEDGRRIPERVHKIKTWDKLAALEKLGRHIGMFTGAGGGEEAPTLNINIEAAAPVGDIRVTRSEG